MKKELFRNILYGGILGDAMGVPYEFVKLGKFTPAPKMTGYGTYNQEPGTWSDDTSLTLLLMEAIAERTGPCGFMDGLKRYYHDGHMTPDGRCFDIGMATLSALDGFPDEDSLGNGALMRMAPLLLRTWDMSKTDRGEEITRWASVTPPANESNQCCVLYIDLMRYLVNAKNAVRFRQYCERKINAYLNISMDGFEPGSRGKVTDTLLTAVWAVLQGGSHTDIILRTIELGGDTDTNALVAGHLAACIHPIDEELVAQIRRKDVIDEVLKKFFHNPRSL